MKLETLVLLLKAICFIMLGMLAPVGVSLAEWIKSSKVPTAMDWGLMGVGAAMGACTQLLAFLSSSYEQYLKQKQANGGTNLWKKQ